MTDNNLKVLILEDNDADAELVQRLLKKSHPGWQFSIVMTKADFANALDNYVPHVIISDNTLPRFSASEALDMVKERGLLVPFILVTGTISEEFAVKIIKAGADDYLLKDRMARLPAAVDAALKQRLIEKEKIDAVKKLRKSEENYRRLVERISDAFIAIDGDWLFTYANNKAGNLFNTPAESFAGRHINSVLPQATWQPLQQACYQAMNQQHYVYREDYYAHAGLWLECQVYPSLNGISVFLRDITVRKTAEAQVLASNEKLRQLTSHLQSVRDEERKRIGREIHDELGQQLTAIKMDVAWVDKMIPESNAPIKAKLKNMLFLLDGSNQAVRRILSELRPVILERNGLIPAVKWLAEQFSNNTGTAVVLNIAGEETEVSEAVAACLFRVFQEAFTNITRYSLAANVRVSIHQEDDLLHVSIEDDGKGFDTTSVRTEKSFGIAGMKERVQALGGRFRLFSSPGKGTSIHVDIEHSNN
ncbi:histidine kinase [Foetidibacter luteolus]|uniref:histidine kinase n=1 Tax=Foetidibacter luteolus TaxID=2608880 RepID=UPI00129BBDDC|nr:histidine kinase [Foetidibacter luteolus]